MAAPPPSSDQNIKAYTDAIGNGTLADICKMNNKMTTSFKTGMLSPYFRSSAQLAELYDIKESGDYISTLTKKKVIELGNLNTLLSNNTRLSEQTFRNNNYLMNSTIFYTMFIKYTLVLSSLIFIIAALTLNKKLSTQACMILSILIIIVFSVVFMLNIGNNLGRKNIDWSKFNWGTTTAM